MKLHTTHNRVCWIENENKIKFHSKPTCEAAKIRSIEPKLEHLQDLHIKTAAKTSPGTHTESFQRSTRHALVAFKSCRSQTVLNMFVLSCHTKNSHWVICWFCSSLICSHWVLFNWLSSKNMFFLCTCHFSCSFFYCRWMSTIHTISLVRKARKVFRSCVARELLPSSICVFEHEIETILSRRQNHLSKLVECALLFMRAVCS